MKVAPSRTASRVVAGLIPLVLIASLIPLLAPTCGGFLPGVKTFAKKSLIIPMDVCYQCTLDDSGAKTPTPSACGQTSYVTPTGNGFQGGYACPQATDGGDVVKAYGLVYQLIRNGVTVYWTINKAKATLDAEDFQIAFSGGPPAQLYDWATGGSGAAVTSQTSVVYRGGPFVVDGSDYARASEVLQQYKSTFQTVNVHVSNVAFQADVARTMSGGWSAGGTVAPKLALLDIGSGTGSTGGSGSKNSEMVIRGYLTKSGLDFTGAGGTSAAGAHGQIYDKLVITDFVPSTPGDWTTTRLYQNGYQILWVPHWYAAGSCTTVTSCGTTQVPDPQVEAALRTIGSFVKVGKKDLFAECAGLGSFEGVPGETDYSPTGIISTAQAEATRFQSTTGMAINGMGTLAAAKYDNPTNNFSSPLLQLGDYPFVPLSGAIDSYHPAAAYVAADTAAPTEVPRLVAASGTYTVWDYFTVRPAHAGHGTVAYLAGHSYSGTDGSYQTAGTRLVLNTLFNLGASCVASGVSCSTGLLGICGTGAMTCDAGGNQVCSQISYPRTETCNGLDDDCNGLVDDGLTESCYEGAPNTICSSADITGGLCSTLNEPKGICRRGVMTCEKQANGSYSMTSCVGQQMPATEVCNGLDDDCDGLVDEGLTQNCYDGPGSTIGTNGLPMGICKRGVQSCTNGSFAVCRICSAAEAAQLPTPPADCQILPLAAEYCGGDGTGNGLDDNCTGQVDEGCGCTGQPPRTCYAGPSGTAGAGPCQSGTQTCVSNAWGECDGQVLPIPEICTNSIDDDCNGIVNDPAICSLCPTPPSLASCHPAPATMTGPGCCYDGPAGTVDVGVCRAGVRACTSGVYGVCENQLLPSSELCNGLDDNCNGTIDDGAACGTGFQCVNGVCVFGSCAPEFPCPEGYNCTGISPTTGIGTCSITGCGSGAACGAGLRCLSGICVDPCSSMNCAPPSICAGGLCTGGSCYSTGCGSGLACQNGICVADSCSGIACPSGTFCRTGDCVQSCTFISCAEGQRCGIDGFCVADPCSGVTCASDRICNTATGACDLNLCDGLSCGAGQMCEAGFCVDDPCATIDCPVGICYRGQCFPSGNPYGLGTITKDETKSGGGCGCATGTPSPGMILLGLLLLPLARRRKERRLGGLGGLAALALATGLLSGCPGSDKAVDLSTCAETCGEQRCVDVGSDAGHCGTCATPCVSGEICVDGMCGPGSLVAPYIRSVTPGSAGKGTSSVAVQLVGDRFQSGATLRVIHPPALPISVATVYGDSQHLQATVNLSTDPISTIYFRVVNPDHVISPVVAFQVVPVSPVVTAWTQIPSVASPLIVKVGPTPTTLHAVGSGLTTASLCHIFSSITAIDQALPTFNSTGTALDCTLDTADMSPGSYDLWVVNDGLLPSAKSTLTLTSDTLTLASLSPSSGAQGSAQPISVTLYGTGFTTSSVVQLSTTAGGGTYAPQVTTFLDPTRLLAQFDLNSYPGGVKTALPAGAYNVRVSNGGTNSPVLSFSIISNPPTVNTVGFSPQPIYQNATETVTVGGANLPANTVVQVLKPGATVPVSLTTTWNSASQVTATLPLTPPSSWPTGGYQILLSFPTTGATSASFPFTVLSNVAVLSSITPAGADQGRLVPSAGTPTLSTLTLTGANFFTDMKVFVLGLGTGGTAVEVTPVVVVSAVRATAGNSGTPLSLVGRETGQYLVVARNFGAADSNSLSFSVTPGAPTITARSPSSTTQSLTPVTVTISGTNFALPDAGGNGGSQVVAWNTGLLSDGVTQIIPASTPINVAQLPGTTVLVQNSGTIVVTLDTRSVLATTSPYTIQVWNPGGPTPPQKSGTTTFTVTP